MFNANHGMYIFCKCSPLLLATVLSQIWHKHPCSARQINWQHNTKVVFSNIQYLEPYMLRLPMCCHLATQESTGLQEAINPLKLALQQVDNSTSRSSNLESYLVHSRILSLRSLKWRTCRRKQVETMSLCLKWGFPKHPVPIHSCHSRHSQTALSTWPALAFEGAYRSRGGPSMQTNKETD